ncbi:MAG: FkbM family methyltransferase, partial [Solirubrobacteraceae bacterium]
MGKWIVSGIAALRTYSGLPYHVVGVESEPTHFKWMEQHLKDNDADAERAKLMRAAVAREDGQVWFHVGAPADWYGQGIAGEPEQTQSTLGKRLIRSLQRRVRGGSDRGVDRVRAVSLRTLLGPLDRVDLIDADIQGAEADAIEPAADLLDAKVKLVYVATHNRDNEDRVRAVFKTLGESLWDYP